MSVGYEVVRYVNDKSLHVIFRAGEFESLPLAEQAGRAITGSS